MTRRELIQSAFPDHAARIFELTIHTAQWLAGAARSDEDAPRLLGMAFFWPSSPEGWEYWTRVANGAK